MIRIKLSVKEGKLSVKEGLKRIAVPLEAWLIDYNQVHRPVLWRLPWPSRF
jgi:hypothetical protein